MNFDHICQKIFNRCLLILSLIISSLQNLISKDSCGTKIINPIKITLTFLDALGFPSFRFFFGVPATGTMEQVNGLSSKEISEFSVKLDKMEINENNRDELITLKNKLETKI